MKPLSALALPVFLASAAADASSLFHPLSALSPLVHHDVEFGALAEEEVASQEVEMQLGETKFVCKVPLEPREMKESVEIDTESLLSQGEAIVDQFKDCIYDVGPGYWGYQLCPESEIVQFAPEWEADGDLLKLLPVKNGQHFVLGRSQNSTVSMGERNGVVYLQVLYSGGQLCDLTGSERFTEVIYFCDPEVKTLKLDSVEETAICEYRAYVAHPELCTIEGFHQQRPPQNHIVCAQIAANGTAVPVPETLFPLLKHM